jgi:hypothetical protein
MTIFILRLLNIFFNEPQEKATGVQMNIFFYTTCKSDEACHYLKQLQNIPILKTMTILPAGSLFFSPLALKLRSGDLLMLFATNSQELDELITLKNEFNDFKIILILADHETISKGYFLQPRFITLHNETTTTLEAVIKKTIHTNMLFTQH